MGEKRFALLIDADNISTKYIEGILNEMTKHGEVTYRRIYGDFTAQRMNKWNRKILQNSLTPVQQFPYTTGKNATDSALIIDAMDILYEEKVDGFCLVSSDSDFTRLASRLRESGMEVIGMGEKKTPEAFREACSRFTYLEVLIEEEKKVTGKISGSNKTENRISLNHISDAIIEIITANDNKGKDTGLGEIGSTIVKKYSDFDVRNFGFSSLSKLLENIKGVELIDNKRKVMLKSEIKESEIQERIRAIIKGSGSTGINLGQLAQKLYKIYPNFKPNRLGYSTFQKLIQNVPRVAIKNGKKNQKFAVIENN